MVKRENRSRWAYSRIASDVNAFAATTVHVNRLVQTHVFFQNTRTVNETSARYSTVILNDYFSSSFREDVDVLVRDVRVFSFDFYGFHLHQFLLPLFLSLFCKHFVFLDVV